MCTCTGGGGGNDHGNHGFGIGAGAGVGAGAGTAAAAGCAASLELCPWTCSKACPTAMTVRLRSLPMMARISSRRGSLARGIAVSPKCYGCFDHAGASAPNAPIYTGSSPAEPGSACMCTCRHICQLSFQCRLHRVSSSRSIQRPAWANKLMLAIITDVS